MFKHVKRDAGVLSFILYFIFFLYLLFLSYIIFFKVSYSLIFNVVMNYYN